MFFQNKKRHRHGKVAEWLKAIDCKSIEIFLRRFKSCLSHEKKKQPCFFPVCYVRKGQEILDVSNLYSLWISWKTENHRKKDFLDFLYFLMLHCLFWGDFFSQLKSQQPQILRYPQSLVGLEKLDTSKNLCHN